MSMTWVIAGGAHDYRKRLLHRSAADDRSCSPWRSECPRGRCESDRAGGGAELPVRGDTFDLAGRAARTHSPRRSAARRRSRLLECGATAGDVTDFGGRIVGLSALSALDQRQEAVGNQDSPVLLAKIPPLGSRSAEVEALVERLCPRRLSKR